MTMIFIETPIFTEDVREFLTDEMYARFQWDLASNPDAGDVIVGTGGLRKVRCAVPGRGKSGGARVIYYWRVSESQILLLAIYRKGRKDELTAVEKRSLRKIVETW